MVGNFDYGDELVLDKVMLNDRREMEALVMVVCGSDSNCW